MKKTYQKIGLLLLTLVLGFSLVACGGKTNSDEVVFTYAVGGEPNLLDPAIGSDAVTSAITNQLYYPLFSIGYDGSLVNNAVKDYSVSDDGLVYTFNLHEENYWSDGQKVTAADYAFGMKRSVGMGEADSYYSYFITDYVKNAKGYSEAKADIADMVDIGIEALDDLTLVVTLEKPTIYFVNLMPAGVFYPLRADFAKEHESNWALNPDVPTNGAFQTVKIDSVEEFVMVQNEHYPHKDKVKVDKLVAKIMTDMDAQLLAFQNGEIDFATSLNSDVTTIYKDKPELIITDSVINYFALLNAYSKDSAALKDVKVRKALQLAINRDDIVTALDAGEAFYPLYGFVPKGISGAVGDFRTEQDEADVLVKTDVDAAKALLLEAGYGPSNPLKLTYYYNSNAMHDTVAQVMQQQWAQAGIDVTLKTGEIRTFFDDRDNGLFEMARHAMSADYMDPSTYLDMAAGWNQKSRSWGDEHYDSLIKKSQGETNVAKRMEILHEAEAYLVKDTANIIPLFGYSTLYLLKDGTKGIDYSPQAGYALWYVDVAK